jgi:hypothetical protein
VRVLRAQQLRASCLCLGAWDKDGTSAMREFGGHTGVW